MTLARTFLGLLLCLTPAVAAIAAAPAAHGRDAEIADADTRGWWHLTETLADDAMEGRDTGSPGYERAAQWVAERFRVAGLKPAGEHGSYFQAVPLHEIAIDAAKSEFDLLRADGTHRPLRFLEDIMASAAADLPAQIQAPLTFRGYCAAADLEAVTGKVVICFGNQRAGLPSGAARAESVRRGGALAIVNVDDPYFTLEPPRWPSAYARSFMRRDELRSGAVEKFAVMRISAATFAELLSGSAEDPREILRRGGAREPLKSFDLATRLQVRIVTQQRDLKSHNVLAVLPGSDASLRDEHLIVSAHLDGYGYGTPVNGDRLYNGALDDAAYVALLIRLAENIHAHRLPAPKRSVLLAAFTGEEKGLLGSYWYVDHPAVPLAQTVANVNLDQLRPLFPLTILTAEALDESSLGDTARAVAQGLGIQVRADAEPERNLLRRADQYPFLQKAVPAISFVFGYDAGTDAERRYREWYQTRYHRPQDDLRQPIDFVAATKFNHFFYRLVDAIASAAQRPAFKNGSEFARH